MANNAKKVASQPSRLLNKKGDKSKTEENEVDDLAQYGKKVLVKPKDQLELTDNELKDIVPRTLTSVNPRLRPWEVEWSYGENQFVPIPTTGSLVQVYYQQGGILRKDSEEATQQMIELGMDPSELEIEGSTEEELEEEQLLEEEEVQVEGEEDGKAGDEEDEDHKPEAEKHEDEPDEDEGDEVKGDEDKKKSGRPKKITNQFNFCERAALTFSNPSRPQETQTIPPPMATYSAYMHPSSIYDTYQDDYDITMKEQEREKREKMGLPPKIIIQKTPAQIQDIINARMLECARVLERMINQNTYSEIAKDYRYWNDPADDFRKEEGTVLPLWKMTFDKGKRHTVTDLEWNPHYYDLFIVTLGFFDFSKPLSEGAVCIFTLKNPSYPDYICPTESAAMCVHTHVKYPYMIVVGLYDGTVLVYNVHASCKEPLYKSHNIQNKHRGIVWEIKWGDDLPDGELNFFSVSGDGKVNQWVLMQTELAMTTIITVHLDYPPVPGPDGTVFRVKACVTCIKLHPSKPQIYLIGTEEGFIFKCSMLYSSMYLMTYNAHQMPVSRIDYNKFNTDIFISCSVDWRIKIWEDDRNEPLFVFDIGDRIGDVKWAPFSSTVFACATAEGRFYLYDLNLNKYKPVCTQAIVSKKKNKITRLAFNYKLPIVIIGDDKGCTTAIKLSPNLRLPCKAPKKSQGLDQFSLQLMKLDKLLSLVREPSVLPIPEDTAEAEDD